MKRNGTRTLLIVVFIQLLILIFSFSSKAQPDYDFTNGSLESGTDLALGAKYRFTNVKPGVDAMVAIKDMTGGLTLNSIDGNSGFKEAFQPVIQVPANSSGYAEFTIDFVKSGTAIPSVMLEVPMTCIDVDGKMIGGSPIYEFDMVEKTPGVYVDFNLLGGELKITFDPTWITGTNTAAIDYPGVDTLAKQAMFSTISANVSSLTVRVGANNQTNASQQRLRSIYFMKFSYANSYLAKSPLLSFSGVEKNKKIELQWELDKENKLSAVEIEKSTAASSFKLVGEVRISGDAMANQLFRFTDNDMPGGNMLYRLKMVSVNGSVQYSNILAFRNSSQASSSFKIYPSAIQSSATLSVQAGKAGTALLQFVDYSGRIVHHQQVTVQEGINNLQLNSVNNVLSGNYLAVLRIDNNTYTQKILKQ